MEIFSGKYMIRKDSNSNRVCLYESIPSIYAEHSVITHSDDGQLWGEFTTYFPTEEFSFLPSGSEERWEAIGHYYSARRREAREILSKLLGCTIVCDRFGDFYIMNKEGL